MRRLRRGDVRGLRRHRVHDLKVRALACKLEQVEHMPEADVNRITIHKFVKGRRGDPLHWAVWVAGEGSRLMPAPTEVRDAVIRVGRTEAAVLPEQDAK